MITSEMIYQNLILPGKTQKVLELVNEIHHAQTLLQERLFQLDEMIIDRASSRKIAQKETKLLPRPALTEASSPRRKYRSYTDEFRAAAVAKVLKEGRPFKEVAKELDLTKSMFSLWIKAAREGRAYRKGRKLIAESSEVWLSPKILAAYTALSEILIASKEPVPVTKIMNLPGQSKAAMARAITHVRTSGEAIKTRKSNAAFYEWNRGQNGWGGHRESAGREGAGRKSNKTTLVDTPRPRRASKISTETNPLYSDPVAIALREEMKTTKRGSTGTFPKEFSQKLRAYAHEKYHTAGANTGQIAHSLGVAGPSVQRWLKFGIYAKTPTKAQTKFTFPDQL